MNDETKNTFTLTDNRNGKTFDLPIHSPSVGPDVIDVSKLYGQQGYFTFDPGYTSTGSCDSKITYIDGEVGILHHRGYRIEELADQSDYLETCYLILYGELPTQSQKDKFVDSITHHTMIHDQFESFYSGFRRDAHPMAIICGVVGALSAFYHDHLDINSLEDREIAAHRLISKLPTIAAWAYKYSVGQPFVFPRNDLGYAANFLHMVFATPCEDYVVNPVLAKALDRIFILHADHEQNASTSTVRIAGSSHANPFACIAAGVACLWGPAHGGANEAVLKMLKEIGHKDRIPEYIKKARDDKDPFRLSGFGHRVYKNYDPRAAVLRGSCHEVLDAVGIKESPLLELAVELEKIALEDDYFIERKLFPNVDFYSGIIYQAMGFPPSMFTALFAIGRTVGWISHWKEMIEDPAHKIGRPRQLYTGPVERPFVPIGKRG